MDKRGYLSIGFAFLATSAFGAVNGRVISGEARPVAGATVTLYAQETADARAQRLMAGKSRTPMASGRSGGDGRFQLESSTAVGEIEVRANGFAPRAMTTVNGETVTVELKEAKSRSGAVAGNGKAVPEATVVFRGDGDAGGSAPEIVVKTGPDGAYEVPDPDRWASGLVVIHPDFAILETTPEMCRWPSVLRHGLHAGTPIEGSVVDESGRRVAGAELWIGGWPLAKTSAPGTFHIRHAATGWQGLLARTDALVGTAKQGAGKIVIRLQAAHSLFGFVRDAKTHGPLVGAVVSLQGDGGQGALAVTSDAHGRYVFPSLPAGRYGASVVRAGYAPQAGYSELSEVIDLRRSATLQRDFALLKPRRLVGHAEDEQHQPVENAFVTLAGPGSPTLYAGADVFGRGESAARTAGDGSFTVAILSDESAAGGETTLAMPLLVLKEGYAAARVEPVRMTTPGQRSLVVTLARGVEIAGRVTAADGTPISDVAVVLAEDALFPGSYVPVHTLLAQFRGEGWIRSDADGRFVARVQPTLHDLSFRKSGYAPKAVVGYDAAAGQSLDVVLDPAAAVRGHVLRSGGSGVPDVLVFLQEPAGQLTMVTTDPDGAFAIEELSPGHYELHATKEGTGINETRGVEAPASDVRIELGSRGAIRGRVVDAKSRAPVQRFSVAVEGGSEGPETAQAAAMTAVDDPTGTFVIGDFPVGEVAVTVRAEGYLSKRLDAVSAPNDEQPSDLEVALEAGITLRGRVTTQGGRPIADATVSVTAGHDNDRASAESDENGDYELAGLPPGTVTLEFFRSGFVKLRKSLDTADTTRVDATLSRGLSLKGKVVSNGGGVRHANVTAASSSGPNASYGSATTNESGAFTIDGLAPGRYTVEASSTEQGEARLEGIDAEKAGPLRLVLETTPTAALSGVVTGLPVGGDLGMAMVTATGEEGGRSAQAPVDAKGAFRMEKAPAGRVRVQADFTTFSGTMRSSKPRELTLAPDSEAQTVIEFRNDVVITGVVTRDGSPVSGTNVAFSSAGGARGAASARTEGNGQYEIVGVEPGPYAVEVSGTGFSFATEYLVTDSGQFDIDVAGAALRGLVVEAGGGAPIPGVGVSLWLLGRENEPVTSVTTNAKGEFAARSLREGRYRVLTAKDGYGQQTRELDLARGTTPEVAFELVPADGLSVRVVDARDEHPLDAIVVVRDGAKRIVANRHSGLGADGTLTVALAGGQYVLSTSASGYGTATLPVTAPGKGLRVGLTPGGTLVVEAARDLRGRIRLLQPNGEEYVRCWCNGIADIQLTGRRTTIANVTPGSYTIELVDDTGGVTGGTSVVIQEGQVSTARID